MRIKSELFRQNSTIYTYIILKIIEIKKKLNSQIVHREKCVRI